MNELEFREFYEETYKKTYYLIYKLIGDKEEAKDLLHDSYASLMNYFNTNKSNDELIRLLNTIARNKAIDYIKKNKSLSFSDYQFDEESEVEPINTYEEFVPDKKMDQQILREYISKELDKLPNDQKICIMMYFFEEMKINEIAKELSIAEGTVKTRLKKGKEKLKTSIDDYQKKNDIKLYNVSIVPVLLWFFKDTSKEVPVIKFTGNTTLVENTTVTASQTSKASTAIKGILVTTKAKIIAGVVAVGLVATPVIGGSVINNKPVNPMELYETPQELYMAAVDKMLELDNFKVTIDDGEEISETYALKNEEECIIELPSMTYVSDEDNYITKNDILLQNDYSYEGFMISSDLEKTLFNDMEMYEIEDKIVLSFWHSYKNLEYPRREMEVTLSKELFIEKIIVIEMITSPTSSTIRPSSISEFLFSDYNSEFPYIAKIEYDKAIKNMSNKNFIVTESRKDNWNDKEDSVKIIYDGEKQYVADKLVCDWGASNYHCPSIAQILEWDGNLDEAYTFEGFYEHGFEKVYWVDDSISIENGKKIVKGTFRRIFENEYNGEIKNVDHIITGIINENGTFDSLECHWYEWAENTDYEYDGGYIKLTFEIWE